MNIFGYSIEKRSTKELAQANLTKTGSVYADSLLFNSMTGQYISQNLSAAYRAIEIISDSIAILPIEIIDDNNNTIRNHKLNNLFSLHNNNKLTKYNMMKLLIQSVIMKGNGYAYINRKFGEPDSLIYLQNKDVQIHYNELNEIQYYTCDIVTHGRIEPKDMIHLIKNTYDGANGVSVIKYATRSLDIAQQTENTAQNFFNNGGSLSGILTVQGQISEKQREQIKQAWNQTYSTGSAGVAILQGNMSYQAVQLNSKDAQLIESRQFNVQDIARFFSINPVMLGDNSGSSYNSIEAIQTQFVFHTLMPYIQMIEEEFTRKLSDGNIRISLDENYLLRTDKQAEVTYYTSLLDKGVLSIDEVRQAIGYNPIGLTDHVVPYTDISQNTLGNKDTDNAEETKETDNDNE